MTFGKVVPVPLSSHVDSGTSISVCFGGLSGITRVLLSGIHCFEETRSLVLLSDGLFFTGKLFNGMLSSSMVHFPEVFCFREHFPEALVPGVFSLSGALVGDFDSARPLASRVCSCD